MGGSMRPINEIIVHCTATPEGRDVDVATVRQWHIARGWSDIGYHYLIGLDGEIWEGRPVEKIGAHVSGHNTGTIGVCYVGGVERDGKTPKDTRTAEQKQALRKLLRGLLDRFSTITKISGHRDYAAKACPCFNASAEYAGLLSEEPVKPAFSNPMTDDDGTEAEQILQDANFLQSQARELLDKAAALHWNTLQTLRGDLK